MCIYFSVYFTVKQYNYSLVILFSHKHSSTIMVLSWLQFLTNFKDFPYIILN